MHAVFIGGGTPSLLSEKGLDRLLSDIRTLLQLDIDAEITLEANPCTFESSKFRQFRIYGVNRLSIGIQSFNEKHLKTIGRIYDVAQAIAAVDIAANTFDNFNLDLMFALPNQTFDECKKDIKIALSFAPPHLSLYQLTLEPNTLFAKFPPTIPDDDMSADMQEWIHEHTEEAGYHRYEVSAYAKPHKLCKHNLNYWCFGDYLGIGAGAHTKLSFPNRILRQVRYRNPLTFIKYTHSGLTAVKKEWDVSVYDLPFEFMLNTLRLVEGFPVKSFTSRTGLLISTIDRALKDAEQRGLITRNLKNIVPTVLGQRFLNNLQQLFLYDDLDN